MPKKFGILALAWLWVGCFPLWATSTPRFIIESWDKKKRLPEMSVISLAQTRDGYLWLGTGDGLARFDGLQFRRFEEGDIPGLSGTKVVKLFEDSRRNLWVGTEAAGVLRVGSDGKVTRVDLGEPSTENILVSIAEDAAGGVWLRMSGGQLYWYSAETAHLVVAKCHGPVMVESGRVWFASENGWLKALEPAGQLGSNTSFAITREIPVGRLDVLLPSKGGGFWCLANDRVLKVREDRLVDLGPGPWPPLTAVLAAVEDEQGNLIVGTHGSGVFWSEGERRFNRVPDLHSYILCLLVDREGSLWVGSNGGGLYRVNLQRAFEVLDPTEGVVVQSVCEAKEGGLWIAYNGERIDRWKAGSMQTFNNLLPGTGVAPPGQARFSARSVFEDRDEGVWVGGTSIFIPPPLLKLQSADFRPLTGSDAANVEVSAIFQDREGVLWLGTTNGLARKTKDGWKFLTRRDGLSSDSVRAIAQDSTGTLWVGTERGGLDLLRDGKFTVFRKQAETGLPSDDIRCLHIDPQEVVWVGTPAGLARYDHGQWTRYTTRDGLGSNRIRHVLDDGKDNLWLGSSEGLMRVSKQNLAEFARHSVTSIACRTYDESDGLPTSECTSGSQPGACRMRDGTLCFPTIAGLIMLNPAQLRQNTNPPPVVIEAVRLDERLQTPGSLRAPCPEAVTVPAGTESLEIVFASLNLLAPNKGLCKYLMKGYETKWTEQPSSIRSARYSKLPHGHYTFQVLACNEDGVWNLQGASLAITVLPPFWQTWWFLTASTLFLLGMIVGSVHYISTQKLQRQLAVLRQQEALEKERARIARDLHDQLGANLTQVALLGEMAETDKDLPGEIENHARQISQTARDTTRALDEIVWTVNPSNDTLDGLINYVCKYAQEYLATAGLRYRLEVPAQLPERPISPELRHNVFLAVKEAINNVVKHADATSVWLRLELNADRFALEIEDNGRGLAPADRSKRRNGLRNMRKRMEDIGGDLELTPGAEGGTRVRFTAPLAGTPNPGSARA